MRTHFFAKITLTFNLLVFSQFIFAKGPKVEVNFITPLHYNLEAGTEGALWVNGKFWTISHLNGDTKSKIISSIFGVSFGARMSPAKT